MSTSSQVAASRNSSLSPLWLLLLAPVAAWYSLFRLGNYAFSDTPLAFVALVPFLAAFLLYHDVRASEGRPDRSDPFIDGLIFLVLAAICWILVFALPARLSWYYWFQRLDLLVVPIFTAAIVVLLWGLGGAMSVRRALLYLVLVWPLPLTWLHQLIGPALVQISAFFGAVVVKALGLPLAVSAADPTRFTSTGPQSYTLTIADTCSGMNALVGFIVVGLPLVLTWSGAGGAKALWLSIGAFLAFLSNLLRIGILLYLATTAGVSFALGTVHPVLGTILFVLVFLGMLPLARCFGLGFRGTNRAVGESMLAVKPKGMAGRAAVIAVAAILLAAGQIGLNQYGPLDTGAIPTTASQESWKVLPQLPGWSQEMRNEINWENIFGKGTQSRVLRYQSGEKSVMVQFVATPDKRLLDSYGLEQCDLFHGEQLVGVGSVDLGHGVSGRIVESKMDREEGKGALNSNTLYWLMPVTVNGRLYHARVALMADTEMMGTPSVTASKAQSNPMVGVQQRLNQLFSPYPESRPEFAELDSYTISIARQMVDEIVAKSGA